MRKRPGTCVSLAALTGLMLTGAPRAWAQGTGPAGPHKSGWEIEGYGGLSAGRMPSGGSTTLPAAGANITTSSPTFQSRKVPTWFLGDGAQLLNDTLAEFDVPQRLSPLDAVLSSIGIERGNAAAFGVRLRHGLTNRLTVEFSVDVLGHAPKLSAALVDQVEATRASFETALGALFTTGPFSNVNVAATSHADLGSGREVAFTGAIVLPFGRFGGMQPYLTAGGGVITRSGATPSVTLDGDYRATLPGGIPIHESDHAVVSYVSGATPAAIAGAGLRRDVSGRWGFRLDGRVFLGTASGHTRVDTLPAVATATPAGFIESFTTPSIQFSNNPSTGRASTLGAPGLQDFAVFKGGGLDVRVLLSVGIYRRF